MSENGPTGAAYKEKWEQERKERQYRKELKQNIEDEKNQIEKENRILNDDDEDNGREGEDNDLRKLRENRLKMLKKQQNEKIENLSKGHGQYREVVQDQFLAEVTSSDRVICHFYHRDFNRCVIMDHHLSKLSKRHIETKFVKINAEKTPFFVEKLKIRSMPTLAFFSDGVCYSKLIGFEGLTDNMPEGKEDEFPTITLARYLGSVNIINNDAIVDDEGIEAAMKEKMETLRKEGYAGLLAANLLNNDEDDFNIDD